MADLRIDEASQAALKERLASPEGRAALDSLVTIIARAVARNLPPGFDPALDTPEGRAALHAAWPDIVAAALFSRAPVSTEKQEDQSG